MSVRRGVLAQGYEVHESVFGPVDHPPVRRRPDDRHSSRGRNGHHHHHRRARAQGRAAGLHQCRPHRVRGDHAYEKHGKLAKLTDPPKVDWTWIYDARGRQTTAVDPDKGTSTPASGARTQKMTWNAQGNLETVTEGTKKTSYTTTRRATACWHTTRTAPGRPTCRAATN
ncbi:hypothetical protein [Streptomyces sp. NPDC101132]|uniref:hypothetical protein n=1 Tax=Streptomyces sp. NPDC101132 TaxID=3366110 RepID=UPI00380779F2